MTITLGGVTLPDVIIADEFGTPNIAATATPTAGGGVNIQEYTISKGQYMTLVGGANFAWITRTTLIALKALADNPLVSYTLTYESTTYTVRFAHETPPVIEATPIVARPNQASTDKYNNLVIKLMRV